MHLLGGEKCFLIFNLGLCWVVSFFCISLLLFVRGGVQFVRARGGQDWCGEFGRVIAHGGRTTVLRRFSRTFLSFPFFLPQPQYERFSLS